MNKRLSFLIYLAIALISLVMLIMTVIVSFTGNQVFGVTLTVVLLSLFSLALVISIVAFNPRKLFYSIGFYVLHVGLALFLLGACIYMAGGQKYQRALSVVGENDRNFTTYNQIKQGDELVQLGFDFAVTDFKCESYEDGSPKYYEASVYFKDGDGSSETVKLTVNHPVRRNGWKIYLMSYNGGSVYLTLKKDNGEFVSTAGIILIILGTFFICFVKPREKSVKKRGVKV